MAVDAEEGPADRAHRCRVRSYQALHGTGIEVFADIDVQREPGLEMTGVAEIVVLLEGVATKPADRNHQHNRCAEPDEELFRSFGHHREAESRISRKPGPDEPPPETRGVS